VTLNHRVVGSIPTQPTLIYKLTCDLLQNSFQDRLIASSKSAVTMQVIHTPQGAIQRQ
jgi:hypothetical protein